ncbi:MAG: hypothetical protein HFJ25_01610 [Clostridia bacterium]|nr:hypothetical protein [Clostridia bacterium]
MTFYNPFFPPFPRYPVQNSTKNTQTEEKKKTNTTQEQQTLKSEEKNNIQSQKNNRKKPLDLGFIRNYLEDTDTLILLGLLFFLYKEENKNLPLMFCLFLLLLDN